MGKFYSDYLNYVRNGFEEIRIRFETDRSLPEERRTMAWDLRNFIRLDQEFLPKEGASPQAQISFQQLSSTLSELALRGFLKGNKVDDLRADFLIHATLLFEIYLEGFENEVKKEVKNEEEIADPVDPSAAGGF